MQTIPWEEVREIVDAVLDLSPPERASYLESSCPNSVIRRYVQSLILSYEQAGDFLEQSLSPFNETSLHEYTSWRGQRIGPYEILNEIGEGGMGTIYLARRADDHYDTQVAIKLVRRGFDSNFTVARFRAERQILANLDHPNIARLLDGGSTEDGQPYLVMGYIEGLPLDQYCDDHQLTIAGRLQLFRVVCSAVQFAHQNLVIHRDIKPSNILVTSDGTPKLLDFGIAKILDPETASPLKAEPATAYRMLTPEYASPEQLSGAVITTASDTYSLGVVLYELLTGQRPHLQENETAPETEKPSLAVSRIGRHTREINAAGQSTALSSRGESSYKKLRKRLSGDLDNIVLMALRRDPLRRYASVEQFSEDIRLHLEGMPVIARPSTFAYRSSKFIRRHKAAVASAVLLVLSLVAGLAATTYEVRVAQAQRARAELRFNEVRKLANSLMFDIHDAIRDLPGATPARKLVVSNALIYLNSLAAEAHDDPSLQHELADAYERVGSVQGQPYAANLGDTAGALDSYRKAQAIRSRLAATGSLADQISLADNYRTVSALEMQGSDTVNARHSAMQSVNLAEQLVKAHPDNQQVMSLAAGAYADMGATWEDSHAGSGEQYYRKALELNTRLATLSTDRNVIRNMAIAEYNIGRYFRDAGYRAEAVAAFNKALAAHASISNDPNNIKTQRDVASVQSNLGDTLVMMGDAAGALNNYRSVQQFAKADSDADPKNADARSVLGESYLNVGTALAILGRRTEALAQLHQSIRILETAVAADPKQENINWDLTACYSWAASVESSSKAQLEDLQKALAIDLKLAGADSESSVVAENEAEVRVQIGNFFLKQGQQLRAQENYRQAIALVEPIAASHADSQEARYPLAGAYFGLGKLAELDADRSGQANNRTKASNWTKAKSHLEKSADTWRQIRQPAHISPNGFSCHSPTEATREIARCDSALALLRAD